MGKSVRHALSSQLRRILRHLIKLEHSPSSTRAAAGKNRFGARAWKLQSCCAKTPASGPRWPASRPRSCPTPSLWRAPTFDDYRELDATVQARLRQSGYSVEQILGDWFPPDGHIRGRPLITGGGGDYADTITLRRPDDWHVHFRDGAMLQAVVPWTARQFARAIVMPNLVPPVTTVAAARAYRERIVAALPPGAEFTPLMTCYLTDGADPDEIARGYRGGRLRGGQTLPGARDDAIRRTASPISTGSCRCWSAWPRSACRC